MKLFLTFFKYTFMKKFLPLKTIAIVFIIAALSFNDAQAQIILPTGGKVIYGDTNIKQSNTKMILISSTPKNVIVWDSFSVGSGGTVIFDNNQYLNLVKGNQKSIIEGTVSSLRGGSFALVNPNGIEISKTGSIDSGKVVLSTAKVTEKEVESFTQTGEFIPAGSGMGKIGINGTITSENLVLNGGQIIIRDIENLTFENSDSGVKDLRVASSTKRIDVGGSTGIDLNTEYGLNEEDGLVSHLGQTAISDKADFIAISDRTDGEYFLTADVDLGIISETIGRGSPFTGSLDGAFNEITYKLEFNPATSGSNAGLFDSLNGAKISNLRISNPEITLNAPYQNQLVGGLAGVVTDSMITNVEVNKLTVKFIRSNDPVVIAGGLAGKVTSATDGNYFENVSAGFSTATQDTLFSTDRHTAGTLFGVALGESRIHGQVFGKTAYYYDLTAPLNAIGRGGILGVSDNYDTEDGLYLKTDEHLHLKDFYLPYFVGSDESFDIADLISYNYKDSLDNPYYSHASLVNVSCDYLGDIDREGVFSHNYTSEDGRFFFIKDGKASSRVTQTVTVTDASKAEETPLLPDEGGLPDNSGSTINPDFPKDDVIQGVDDIEESLVPDISGSTINPSLPKDDVIQDVIDMEATLVPDNSVVDVISPDTTVTKDDTDNLDFNLKPEDIFNVASDSDTACINCLIPESAYSESGFDYIYSGSESIRQYSRDDSIDTENASASSDSKALKRKITKEKIGDIEYITYNQPLSVLAHPLFLATAGIDKGKVNGGAKYYIAQNKTSSFEINS
ncbi:MAG: filamentous hemagglutinin N-terminal domain-containing protein [Succinivibrio sp.]